MVSRGAYNVNHTPIDNNLVSVASKVEGPVPSRSPELTTGIVEETRDLAGGGSCLRSDKPASRLRRKPPSKLQGIHKFNRHSKNCVKKIRNEDV
jgi:hypothetical protein